MRLAATLILALAAAPIAARAAADATADDDLPGVDASALTPAQRQVLLQVAADEFCYCGCPHTLGGCLRQHKGCKHAPRMATLAARLAGQGMTAGEILKVLTDYYASFDRRKRSRIDVADYGPPLGRPDAPITVVEFSDFTCPYCQALKPELDRFFREHDKRVKLYYKPFPLPGHERSLEAALAAEWARGKGLLWKMYDELFAHPHALSDEALAADATAIGGDPDDLLKAVQSRRDKARVTASQQEALAAGLTGTPTLFFDGRRLAVPVSVRDAPDLLRFTLEDEEEWKRNGGWGRDE